MLGVELVQLPELRFLRRAGSLLAALSVECRELPQLRELTLAMPLMRVGQGEVAPTTQLEAEALPWLEPHVLHLAPQAFCCLS